MAKTANMLTQEDMNLLMGKKVEVYQIMKRKPVGDRMEHLPEHCDTFTGWIVGFRWRLNGKTCLVGGDFYSYSYREFQEHSRTPVMLVQKKPTTRPIDVPLDGFEILNPIDQPRC